jgi:hypothetical protein
LKKPSKYLVILLVSCLPKNKPRRLLLRQNFVILASVDGNGQTRLSNAESEKLKAKPLRAKSLSYRCEFQS